MTFLIAHRIRPTGCKPHVFWVRVGPEYLHYSIFTTFYSFVYYLADLFFCLAVLLSSPCLKILFLRSIWQCRSHCQLRNMLTALTPIGTLKGPFELHFSWPSPPSPSSIKTEKIVILKIWPLAHFILLSSLSVG